ncbi:unnamed protein product [Brachionus calyciflorus]|uniref:Uncharacterized protein n=1 Tax=Brachionus calyciflorus TaxID=104777 RepID=A0A814CT99_9BILA|nr:unnamed protein product [Brachionus calyciflorus]
MNDALFGYSIDEINSNREFLKIILVNYSSNVKSYAKWFEISDVDKNEESFTSYKVVYRLLPKDLNESIKEIIVWKRFRDFKQLYEIMQNYHVSLHRKDKFPDFPRAKFFNRFDENVIDERRQASLRLLQFIGSQSHLYRHEKFIEFLADGKFSDYAFKKTDSILKPQKLELKPLGKSELIQQLKNLTSEIKAHLNQNEKIDDFTNDYLKKTTKLIDLVVQNENSDYHETTIKFLNNSSNILSDCIAELECSGRQSEKLEFLRLTNKKLEAIIYGISKLKNDDKAKNEIEIKAEDKLEKSPSQATILNDWILSDFNLKSEDFNNELSLILGNIFDLSFNYKILKILNENCLLVKSRFKTETNAKEITKFVLKRLPKSYNPIITKKSIVPFGNRIPYMCQLLKYYETENTIFLLLEYLEHGRLYTHINYCYQDPDNFTKSLKNFKILTRQESNETIRENSIRRRNSLKHIYSFTSIKKSEIIPKRRTRSEINDKLSIQRLDSKELHLTEVKLSEFKFNINTSSASMSSSSSLSDPDNKTITEKVEIHVKPENKNLNLKKFLNFKFNSKQPLVLFKNSNINDNLSKSQSQSSNESECSNDSGKSYFKHVKLWLAQLLVSIKNLHKIGILLKDLNSDNLLINENGMLVLTYFSRWNLVDERLSDVSVKNFYVAPELCGLVNYEVTEECDLWSFGIIAYEMMTLKRFSDMHSLNQLYVNFLNFPMEFNSVKAKNLIEKLLRLNPNERINLELIENHPFFNGIDWISLESAYWKSK